MSYGSHDFILGQASYSLDGADKENSESFIGKISDGHSERWEKKEHDPANDK